MPEPILMPAMTGAQELGWHALMDLSDDIPEGWSLVGGQMVHLWCADRGISLARPTDDADTLLDVRAQPDIHFTVTAALKRRGFAPETSATKVQHRWRRDEAVIDVLIPRHLSERQRNRAGAGGGRAIETPGGQKVLNRTEIARVRVGEREGSIPRPTLLGAIVGKAAAFTVPLDINRDRHLGDLVVLASILKPSDVRGHPPLDKRERVLVGNAVGNARRAPNTWAYVPNGAEALDRLASIVEAAKKADTRAG